MPVHRKDCFYQYVNVSTKQKINFYYMIVNFQSFLNDIDSVLYVDTDTLFLSPPNLVWDHFYKMNSSQMAALAPEHEDPNIGWYNRFARHPYYGKLGTDYHFRY